MAPVMVGNDASQGKTPGIMMTTAGTESATLDREARETKS